MTRMKAEFDRKFTIAHKTFLDSCSELKSSQDEDWKEIRQAWREYNQERREEFSRTQNRDQKQGSERERGLGRSPS